jgi:long-chain acyl-CoA synthetase
MTGLVAGLVRNAGLHPGRIALRTDDVLLSYSELHAAGSRVAATIQERGLATSPVAVIAEREPAAFVAVVGALLAARLTFPSARERRSREGGG